MTAVVERPAPPGRVERGARAGRRARPGLLGRASSRGAGLVLGLVVLAMVAALSLVVGSKPIALETVWDALWSYDGAVNDHLIVRGLRLPRTLLGVAVGVALGVAGAVMQGITRNPLADPGILGVQGGASLAVVVAIAGFGVGTLTGYVWCAFAGAAVASVVVYGLGSVGRGGATPVKLALAGAAVAALLGSLTSAVLILDVATFDEYRFWVVGALAGRDTTVVVQVAPFLAAGAVLALVSARALNALALGEDLARSLGHRVHLMRGIAAVSVIALSGAATAAAGPIGFIGLTIPHVARAISGPDYRWILPWTVVLAPSLLLGADVIGRVVVRPGELQAGIVTAVLGAPCFVALVRRRRIAEL